MAPTHNPPTRRNHHSDPSEFDKFQTFERWLLANGAQFPSLELRKYDNSDRYNKNNNDDDDIKDTPSENESEEKKDGGGGGGGSTLTLSSPNESSTTTTNDGSDEMRGVHALAPLPSQTVIVSIPLSCLITVEMGQATPIGRKILSSDLELDAPKHIFLMIYLLWDKAVHGSSSFFAPYYDVLPRRLRNMPIFWDEAELAGLKGSHLLCQIRERIQAITRDYRSVCAAAPEFASIATLEEFTWARTIVCSRNFGLMIHGRRTSALVPHADMLNHRRPRETKWTFCEESLCFTITTLREIGAGEQVYDSYGQKCNHRFLLNYGFCVEKNVEMDGFCPNEVSLELGGWDELEEEELYDADGTSEGKRSRLVELICGDDRECLEKKLAFWTRGDVDSVGADYFGSSWHAIASHIGRMGGSSSAVADSASGTKGTEEEELMIASTRQPIVLPTKRVRVCVSNNENTRILFSMLRVLVCNNAELDRISWGGRAESAASQRLYSIPGMAASSSQSAALRMCRDIRYPISLRNERCAMELLLEITDRALSMYPTSFAQDSADLKDEETFPKYSNKRHAKLQVHGEKEVLHHFASWARTAIHVIDIISRELANEIKIMSSVSPKVSTQEEALETETHDEELGFDYVIQTMEDDDRCHNTILRYCSDVLGAIRRDELNQISAEALGIGYRNSVPS